MATITTTEVHPSVGSIWQRVVGLWEGYIGDASVAWSQSVTTDTEHRCVTITLTGATDTNVWILLDGSVRNSITIHPLDVARKTGWRTMPKVQPASQASRTTKTDFNAKLVALRLLIWPAWTNAVVGSSRNSTASPNNFPDTVDLYDFTVRFDAVFFLDTLYLSLYTQTATFYFYNGQQICVGELDPHYNSIGTSGGGTVDLTELIEAVNSIADQEQSFTSNNGGNMYSVRGNVRVGP